MSQTRGNRSTGGHEDVFDDDVAYHDSDRPPRFNMDTKDKEIHLPNHNFWICLVSMLNFQDVVKFVTVLIYPLFQKGIGCVLDNQFSP